MSCIDTQDGSPVGGGGGVGGGVAQEIALTVANVSRDAANAIAGGLIAGVIPGFQSENVNSRVQYVVLQPPGENTLGVAWEIVIPGTYTGNGLTVQMWVTGDGSPSNPAGVEGVFEANAAGANINASDWDVSAVPATGNIINGTAFIVTMMTMVFPDADIGGLIAGAPGRFSVYNEAGGPPFSYAGDVRVIRGRIFETP